MNTIPVALITMQKWEDPVLLSRKNHKRFPRRRKGWGPQLLAKSRFNCREKSEETTAESTGARSRNVDNHGTGKR
jgi:hypothetical protein